jgi:predicted dehydrogenase
MLSRRTFVAAAVPALASTVGAADDTTAKGPIRTGLLNTQHGHLDGKMKAMLNSPDYKVVCASEPDPATRRKRQAQPDFRDLRWVSEDQLLGDPSIQLVVVEPGEGVVVAEAMGYGRKVIDAGKHLHLEKPPTNRMQPFRELVEQARRRNLLLQMGYIWRFHEGITAAIEAARQGWLGDVYMLRGTINTDLTAEARLPLVQYHVDMMLELGCHIIDRVVDLWGRPTNVRSWLRHDTPFDDKLPDNTLAVLEYEKAMALVVCSASMPGHNEHRSFELIGTDGLMLIQPVEPGNGMRVCLRKARGPYKAGWQEIRFPDQTRFVNDFKELARAIKTGKPLRYSYDHELLVHETILRASAAPG